MKFFLSMKTIRFSSPVRDWINRSNDKFIGKNRKFLRFVFFFRTKHFSFSWKFLDDENHLECLSCQNDNDSCGFAHAKFSLGRGSFYVLECYGPSIPFATLHDRTSKLGKEEKTTFFFFFLSSKLCFRFSALINNNELFREWTSNRLMPYVDYFSVPLGKRNIGKKIFRRSSNIFSHFSF